MDKTDEKMEVVCVCVCVCVHMCVSCQILKPIIELRYVRII
jgi:hypothetical protein